MEMIWYWFECPECLLTWGSDQPVPDREWCQCNSPTSPYLIYEEVEQI